MHPQLREAYERELAAARTSEAAGHLDQAFAHLERAHILGQSYTLPHTRSHWEMLKVGWKRRDAVEVAGQIIRIAGSLLFTWLWVPVGNPGGSRVPPFQSMPLPEDLKELLRQYGSHRRF